MITRYGAYAAKKDLPSGDPDLALWSALAWGFLGHANPSVVDGAVAWEDESGVHLRVAALDLFSETWTKYGPKHRVLVHDVRTRTG